MAKAEPKMKQTTESVEAFIRKVPDQQKQSDSFAIIEMMKKKTGAEAKMWGPSIIGFGKYHYKYESGHEGDAPLAGFSPRHTAIVIYVSSAFDRRAELLGKLGKHKATKACIYIKKLQDIDFKVLEMIVANSIRHVKSKYK